MGEKYIPKEAKDFAAPGLDKPQETPHLTQFAGTQYDVGALESYANELPTVEFSLTNRASLEDILQSKYWTTSNGDSLGPSDLLQAFENCDKDWDTVKQLHPAWSTHIDKVVNVDYMLPALVHKGHLIDGIHRLTKAISENVSTLPVKVLEELPSSAEYHT